MSILDLTSFNNLTVMIYICLICGSRESEINWCENAKTRCCFIHSILSCTRNAWSWIDIKERHERIWCKFKVEVLNRIQVSGWRKVTFSCLERETFCRREGDILDGRWRRNWFGFDRIWEGDLLLYQASFHLELVKLLENASVLSLKPL
jgi:hypothetical protein